MRLRRLSPEQRSIIRAAVADRAPRRWSPRDEDLTALDDLAAGASTVDSCLARLIESWNAPEEPNLTEESATAAVGTATAASAATRATWLRQRASDAELILKRIRKAPPSGADSEWLKRVAAETLQKRGPNGASGALGQFRGHLFEHLDQHAYNIRNARWGRKLVLRANAHAPGYDASRFINRRFAGGIQHKLSASGVVGAAGKINARKAGSATRATVRVPKDQAARATRRVAGRIRIESSDISTTVLKRRGDAGLRRLASRGSAATSSVHQLARSAGVAAATAAAFGALSDARKIYRGEMSAHEFVTMRGVDVGEQAVSQLAGAAATAGVAAGLNSLVGGTGIVAGVAASAAGSAVILPLTVNVAAGAAVLYGLRPVRRSARRWAANRATSPRRVAGATNRTASEAKTNDTDEAPSVSNPPTTAEARRQPGGSGRRYRRANHITTPPKDRRVKTQTWRTPNQQ
jgi:hypothetical protein